MPRIPTYTQQVSPSGRQGEAIQEYKTTGPMTPIDIGAAETAAIVKGTNVVSDVLENVLKIQQYNEILVGEQVRNDFKIWANQAVNQLGSEYQLERAVRTKDNPGITQIGMDAIRENIAERLESYSGSDVMKKALARHLENDAMPYFNSLNAYEKTQQGLLKEKIFIAKQGEAANMPYEAGVLEIKKAVKDLYGGSKAVQDIALKSFENLYGKTYFKKLMNVDSNKAVEELNDPENFYTKMLNADERPDFLHTAMIRAKQDDTLKALMEKRLHDDEERTIGDLYTRRDYAGAYLLMQQSKYLSGDEKKSWANAIDEKVKLGDNISSITRSSEIVKVNDMISREMEPDKIRNYIIQTPYLKDGDKEQYINKLEAKLSADEKEGVRTGYARIKEIIIPKRSILDPVPETPQEVENVRKAQDALDDWVNTQKKNGKYPTSSEIKVKAAAFANMYQTPIPEKMMQIDIGARKTAEAMKQFAEQKVLYDKIPEADKKKIEQELIKRGYPASVRNVIDVYNRNIVKPEIITTVP